MKKWKKRWNQIIELLNISSSEDSVKYTLDDNSKFIEADVPKNTNFVKDHCCQDKFIIVLDSVIDSYGIIIRTKRKQCLNIPIKIQ